MKEIYCQYCKRSFNNYLALRVHECACSLNPNKPIFECEYCKRRFSNIGALSLHLKHCKLSPNYTKSKIIGINNGKIVKKISKNELDSYLSTGWKLGYGKCFKDKNWLPRYWMNKDGNRKMVLKSEVSIYLSNGWKYGMGSDKVGQSFKGKHHTPEVRARISAKMKLVGGGYRIESGRGRKGYYKGFHCDSSWELAFVIYHLDHGLNIKRCDEIRTYEFDGQIHKYHPDFVTDMGIIEIKGIPIDAKTKAKMKFNPDVILIDRNKIWTPYLNYVIDKYGEDFVRLYEK